EVVPGQHLVVGPLPGGEPVEVHAVRRQDSLRGTDPPVVGEVLAPPVEAAAVAPDLLDDPTHPAVAAREQSFDDPGLAVVVAEADRPAVATVRAHLLAEL